jgi:hypothetical protein
MIQLRHDGEPGKDGRKLAALSLHVSDLPELMSNADGLVHAENMIHHAQIGQSMGGGMTKWYGGLTSVAEALALVNDGWASGAERAAAASEGMASDQLARPESIRRRVVWGEEGDRIDWERGLSGDYDTMWGRCRRRRTSVPRMVSLATSFGGNCHRSAEELFWSGAQMVVTAELLQAAGYQVEVRGISGNDGTAHGRRQVMGIVDITAKGYDDPLRLDMLAAVFSHAGVFRTYGFQCYVRLPWAIGYGLGHAVDNPWEQVKQCAELGWLRPVDVFVPAAFNQESAIKNIVAAITAVESRGRAAA